MERLELKRINIVKYFNILLMESLLENGIVCQMLAGNTLLRIVVVYQLVVEENTNKVTVIYGDMNYAK